MRNVLFAALAVTVALSVGTAHAQMAPGAILKDCEVCPEVVVIPAGTFVMGSTAEETERAEVRERDRVREQPPRQVNIHVDFALGRFEVTVAEWRAFTEATGREPGESCLTWDIPANAWQWVDGATWWEPGYEQTDQHPVGCVDLPETEAYVAWLSEMSGQTYRVPTEAEWEYAARAGTSTLQYWSDDMENVCAYANVSDKSRSDAHGGLAENPTRFSPCNDGYVYAAPVGKFLPNQFGLYDMVGNIWEWVQDCFVVGYEGAPSDGSAYLDAPECDRRIVRSGSWYGRNWFNRPAARSREAPDFRASTLGVRVLRELK